MTVFKQVSQMCHWLNKQIVPPSNSHHWLNHCCVGLVSGWLNTAKNIFNIKPLDLSLRFKLNFTSNKNHFCCCCILLASCIMKWKQRLDWNHEHVLSWFLSPNPHVRRWRERPVSHTLHLQPETLTALLLHNRKPTHFWATRVFSLITANNYTTVFGCELLRACTNFIIVKFSLHTEDHICIQMIINLHWFQTTKYCLFSNYIDCWNLWKKLLY